LLWSLSRFLLPSWFVQRPEIRRVPESGRHTCEDKDFAFPQEEWLDLAEEEWKKSLLWVKPTESIIPSAKEAEGVPGAPPAPPPPPPPPLPAIRSRSAPFRAPAGTDAVGWTVDIWWQGDKMYYAAEIESYNEATGDAQGTQPSPLGTPPAYASVRARALTQEGGVRRAGAFWFVCALACMGGGGGWGLND
jgi:hypothetical protein